MLTWLDWRCPNSWYNILSTCVCEGVFQKRLAFEYLHWGEKVAFTDAVVIIIQPIQGLESTERQRKDKFALFSRLGSNISAPISWTFELRLGNHPNISPGSQAFGLRLNYTTGCPKSLAYRWKNVGVLASLSMWVNSYNNNSWLCVC